MTFWTLIRSILLACFLCHPVGLTVMGLAHALKNHKIDGLFAVLATPMTLAFFFLPALWSCLLLIVPTFYGLSRFGRRDAVPPVVLAVGLAILLYHFLANPALTGAIPGYDQTAQVFTGISLVAWAVYAYFRLGLRAS